MKYLKGKEKEEAEKFLKKAEEVAKKGVCKKSQRGVVIVKNGEIIAKGWNGPPLKEKCEDCLRENIKDDSKTELCRGIHAEQRAIIKGLQDYSLEGTTVYLARLKHGKPKPENGPSCPHCAKLFLEIGVNYVRAKALSVKPARTALLL